MQGWRTNMEDAHLAELDFEDDMHMFGVFDGHGGKEVALYVAENLISIFTQTKHFGSLNFEGALYQTFVKLDEHLATKEAKKEMLVIREKNPESK
jgi:serine/threonine protein phosphatase PrpC